MTDYISLYSCSFSERFIVKVYDEEDLALDFDLDEDQLGVIPIGKKPQDKRPKIRKKTDNIRQARKDKQKRQQVETSSQD